MIKHLFKIIFTVFYHQQYMILPIPIMFYTSIVEKYLLSFCAFVLYYATTHQL